jgi:hypothetical protein
MRELLADSVVLRRLVRCVLAAAFASECFTTVSVILLQQAVLSHSEMWDLALLYKVSLCAQVAVCYCIRTHITLTQTAINTFDVSNHMMLLQRDTGSTVRHLAHCGLPAKI